MMHIVNRAASCFALALTLTAITGRESFALIGRPALEQGRDKSLAEVDRLDASFREFHSRPNDSRSGISYADLIRVHESARDRDLDLGRGSITRPGLGIRTVDGKVEQVDRRRNSFAIRSQSGKKISVSLPYDTRRPEVDRFRALRAGDYVRVEGRFLDRDRFELENFIAGGGSQAGSQ